MICVITSRSGFFMDGSTLWQTAGMMIWLYIARIRALSCKPGELPRIRKHLSPLFVARSLSSNGYAALNTPDDFPTMLAKIGHIIVALRARIKRPRPPSETVAFPYARNLILDVMSEGRRKNIIHLPFEAELGLARAYLAAIEASTGERISLTTWVTKCLADTIGEDLSMQGYRKGARQIVLFEDVDVTLMVERDQDGAPMPIPKTIRAVNRKSLLDVHCDVAAIKNATAGRSASLTALEKQFFSLPKLLRRPVWFFIRRNPVLFKDILGTVGVTSLGMFTQGLAFMMPITPMTLTLAIGGVSKKMVLEQGEMVEREFICLNASADHDLIDGAPLMRFAERLRQRIGNPYSSFAPHAQPCGEHYRDIG